MLVELSGTSWGALVGWGRPAAAKRKHYFIAGESLCGRWQFVGIRLKQGAPSDHDCAECRRRWRRDHARRATTAQPEGSLH